MVINKTLLVKVDIFFFVNYRISVPPKINDELGRVVVKRGERAELLCEAVGMPPPQISWLKDNQTLPDSKLQRVIDNNNTAQGHGQDLIDTKQAWERKKVLHQKIMRL